MRIQTFRAPSLQEALLKVRAEMGPEAFVLHTREIKNRRLGILRQALVEVEACVDLTKRPTNSAAFAESDSIANTLEITPTSPRVAPEFAPLAKPVPSKPASVPQPISDEMPPVDERPPEQESCDQPWGLDAGSDLFVADTTSLHADESHTELAAIQTQALGWLDDTDINQPKDAPQQGTLGWTCIECIEIQESNIDLFDSTTVLRDQEPASTFEATDASPETPNDEPTDEPTDEPKRAIVNHEPESIEAASTEATDLVPIRSEAELRASITNELTCRGFEFELATSMLKRVFECTPNIYSDDALNQDSLPIQEAIVRELSQRVSIASPPMPSGLAPLVIAFVGPTGVGKTSTLAKVATHYRQNADMDIGLLTIDTLRHGAVDQLLEHAEQLSARLEVVEAKEQIEPALRRMRDCDLVLIDTAGRAPTNSGQIAILRDLLAAAKPDITQLVLSASSSARYAAATMENFSVVDPSQLVITKLDETVDFGTWAQQLTTCGLPVSYLTTGQSVSEDLTIAKPHRVARLLLGNRPLNCFNIPIDQRSPLHGERPHAPKCEPIVDLAADAAQIGFRL